MSLNAIFIRLLALLLTLGLVLSACSEGIIIGDQIIDDPDIKDPNDPDIKDPNDPDVKDPITAEQWARALIDQKVTVEAAFEAISQSTGLPVVTEKNTVIFLHWYKGGSWSVAGEFNAWALQAMTDKGEFSYAEVPLPAQNANPPYYKFVNDGTYSADPWALRYNYDENGEISYYQKPATSHLMRWNGFKSPQGLKTRAIRAWVPASSGPYGVLYAHDGQNLFDPGAMHGGWKLPQILESIGANFVVVGIDNSEDRMSEYTHIADTIDGQKVLPKGKEYADFVEKTVRPFIESRIATTDKAGLMGSSLGGLISLYVAHRYPDRYKMAIGMSSTLAWGNFSDHNKTMRDLYVEAGHRKTVIFVDSGGNQGSGCNFDPSDAKEDEDDRDNYCATVDFFNSLKNIGYTVEKDLYHWHEPGAEHTEAAWAARADRPLKIFLKL